MIFICLSYVTVCYKATTTRGTPLSSCCTLVFPLSKPFWKSHLLSTASPPLVSQSFLFYSEGSCYQMLTAASWPMPLYFTQHLHSYLLFSPPPEQLDLSWTTVYWYYTMRVSTSGCSTTNLKTFWRGILFLTTEPTIQMALISYSVLCLGAFFKASKFLILVISCHQHDIWY